MTLIELEFLSRALVSLAAGTLLRWSLLCVVCGGLIFLLRKKPAEMRHGLYRVALFALFLLPILEIVEPPLQQASNVVSRLELIGRQIAPQQRSIVKNERVPQVSTVRPDGKTFPWALIAIVIYTTVTLTLLARLLMSALHLRCLASRSDFIPDRDFQQIAHHVWLESEAAIKPRIRVSGELLVPIAMELDETMILLPASWRCWSKDKLRIVLTHEMAHAKRRDPAMMLLASLALCFVWMHPFGWFLRRQLALLAEEICDGITLRTVSKVEDYARILIDFAAAVTPQSGRISSHANAMGHRSQIKKRLEKIFARDQSARQSRVAARALSITILVPALYLTAAVRLDDVQLHDHVQSQAARGIGTPEQAAQLESELERNPEDLNIRGALMAFYENERYRTEFTNHLLWAIEHYPESQLAGMKYYHSMPGAKSPNDALVQAAWERALAKNGNSADVLFHAGLWIVQNDPRRGLALYRRARDLDFSPPESPDKYTCAIAIVYAAAVITDLSPNDLNARLNGIAFSPGLATVLSSEIKASGDAALLSQVGTDLVQISANPGQDRQSEIGFQLIQKAIDADPNKQQWKEALDSAQAEPIRRHNLERIQNLKRRSN